MGGGPGMTLSSPNQSYDSFKQDVTKARNESQVLQHNFTGSMPTLIIFTYNNNINTITAPMSNHSQGVFNPIKRMRASRKD